MLAAHRARAFFGAFVLAALAACSVNPLTIAQTPEQKYAAAKLTYDAVLATAVTVVNDPGVPATVKQAIQAGARSSGEIYKSLNEAYVDYVAARAALAPGATTDDKLKLAAANLETWLAQLTSITGELAKLAHH